MIWLVNHSQIARSFTAIDLRPKRMHYLKQSQQLGYTQHNRSEYLRFQLGNFNKKKKKNTLFFFRFYFKKAPCQSGRGKSV